MLNMFEQVKTLNSFGFQNEVVSKFIYDNTFANDSYAEIEYIKLWILQNYMQK